MVIQVVFAIVVSLVSGHAIETIYKKAGFIHVPKFIFWIPVFHFAFLIHLAFCKWPIDNNAGEHPDNSSNKNSKDD